MTDLVTLAAELRAVDLQTGLDLALKLRAARRPRHAKSAKQGWSTRRENEALTREMMR